MSIKKLAIIIPVYNQEKLVKRCLESIYKQITDDLEIIIIDDGSTDKSKKIIKNFIKDKSNFIYFYKINGGVSSARNLGIKKSNSEYITFVDPDDYLEDDYVENVINEIKNKKIELLCFNYYCTNNHKKKKDLFLEKSVIKVKKHDGLKRYLKLEYQNIIKTFVWNKIFNTKIIKDNNIYYDETKKIGEDTLFCAAYIEKIKRINTAAFYGYNYYYNELSVMNKYNNFYLKESVKYIESFNRIGKENEYKIPPQEMITFYLSRYLGLINNEVKGNSFFNGWNNIKEFTNNKYLKENIKSINFQQLNLKIKIYYILVKYKLSWLLYTIMWIKSFRKKSRR